MTGHPTCRATVAGALMLVAACPPAAAQQSSTSEVPQDTGDAVRQFRLAHTEFVQRAVFVPPVVVRGFWMPSAQLGGEPGHFDTWGFDVDATIPVPVDRDSFLIFGLEAGFQNVQFTNVQTVANETLYKVGPRLGYGAFLSDDLVVQAYWQPSIYSDFGGNLDHKDYRPEYGTALAVWRQSDDLFWKVGFKITDAIDTGVVPLGGVMWHFGEPWMLDVLAPRHAMVRYRADSKWTVSGGVQVRADEYHIRGPAALGKPEHDVHTQEVLLQLESEYRLTDNLASQLAVGMTLAGEWDWGYGNGQPKYDGTLDPGVYLQWSLGWRF